MLGVCNYKTYYNYHYKNCVTKKIKQYRLNKFLLIKSIINPILEGRVIQKKQHDITDVVFLCKMQSTLVISTSVISNNRLSRRENLILVSRQKSNIR